jgi:adenylate kinase
MILRLIMNELTSRGWLRPETRAMPYTLNSTASMASFENPPEDDGFLSSLASPTSETYTYSDHPSASFILDGFPRTASQAAQIDAIFPINLVVNISTPSSIIMDRICNRWVHEPSGRVYNTTFNAPKVEGKDDVTGEPLTRRSDDDPETWKVRLKKFETTSVPLLEHYDRKGVLWTVEGNSSDEISPKLFKEFGRRFGISSTA